jgi:hypothetical protein
MLNCGPGVPVNHAQVARATTKLHQYFLADLSSFVRALFAPLRLIAVLTLPLVIAAGIRLALSRALNASALPGSFIRLRAAARLPLTRMSRLALITAAGSSAHCLTLFLILFLISIPGFFVCHNFLLVQ